MVLVQYIASKVSASPKCDPAEQRQGHGYCQITKHKPIARRSPHSVMMEAACASSPACRDALSPPPSETGESVGHGAPGSGNAAEAAAAAAVQLASQASHLTLSNSGIDADLSRTGCARMDATTTTTTTSTTIWSPTMPLPPDAQPRLEIVPNACIEEWRERDAIITPRGVLAPPAFLLSVSGSGSRPGIAETHAFGVAQPPASHLEPGAAGSAVRHLLDLPNEVLLQILSDLDVCDLLATSRVSAQFRLLLSLIRTLLWSSVPPL